MHIFVTKVSPDTLKACPRFTQHSDNQCMQAGFQVSSAESQKGVIVDQRCSIENQKGAIAIDFVQQ